MSATDHDWVPPHEGRTFADVPVDDRAPRHGLWFGTCRCGHVIERRGPDSYYKASVRHAETHVADGSAEYLDNGCGPFWVA